MVILKNVCLFSGIVTTDKKFEVPNVSAVLFAHEYHNDRYDDENAWMNG